MDDPQPIAPNPSGQSPWAQWGMSAVLVGLLVVGGLYLRAQRLGAPTSSFPANHVATVWNSWVFLAPAAPGVQPSPVAPPNPRRLGEVTLTSDEFDWIGEIQTLLPREATLIAVPDPFTASRPATVPGTWEPLAKLRARAGATRVLVVLSPAPVQLSPFQTALSWSDPSGRLIVVDRQAIGIDPAKRMDRLARLIRHEFGHLAGCQHRDGCVMTGVQKVEELDRLPLDYCGDCAAKIAAFPEIVPEYGPIVRRVDPDTGAPLK